jgi:O-antigen ligase
MLIGVPWIINIGPLRMSAYRILLCLAFLPCLFYWLCGKAGGIKAADISVIAFSAWIGVSLIAVNGQEGLQSAGIALLETLGPYFLARCCIRNADDFRSFSKALFSLVAILLPLVAIETATGWTATLHIFRILHPTFPDAGMTPRAGFWRAQGPYDHPILLGVVCGSAFTFTYLVLGYGKSAARKYGFAGVVVLATACSLSSGPLLGIFLQVLVVGWKRLAGVIGLTTLWAATILALAAAQVMSWVTNRSIVDMTIGRLTFDPMSYWFRNLIWEYGWSSVWNNPWLGTGLNEWIRPAWMPASIDNFWLYFSVKHGLPASLLIGLSVAICVVSVGMKGGLDKRLSDYRCAYLATVLSLCMMGFTVHFWNAAYVLVLLVLGSGVWIVDVKVDELLKTGGRASARSTRVRTSRATAAPRLHEARPGSRGRSVVNRSSELS